MENTMFAEFEEASAVEASAITLQELDHCVKKLVDLRGAYDEAKKLSSAANAAVEAQENIVMGILTALNRNSYDAEGIAKVTKVTQTVYKVPKDISEKKALYNYIKEKYGAESLMNMTSINHQTLNSWAKAEIQEVSKIPGLELPTTQEYIQVRSSK